MANDDPRIKHVVLDGTDNEDFGAWWEKPDAEIGSAMVKVAEKYAIGMQDRRDASRRYVQLSRGKLVGQSMYDAGRAATPIEDINPAWNVVASAANTAASVVVRNRVRVAIITDGANWELQEAAKDAELVISGIFRANKLYENLDQLWFYDGAVPGLGIMLVEPDPITGKPVIERVIPDELIYSEVEAIGGNPRQIFRIKWYSKHDAVAKFARKVDDKDTVRVDKKIEEAIRNCNSTYNMPLNGSPDYHIPLIPVWTAWVLPTIAGDPDAEKNPGSGDGKRVVGIPGATLDVKPWEWARFPLSFFRVERAPVGIWGIGLAERAAGYQYRLFEINRDIDECRRGGSKGKWMVDVSASVNDDELNDEENGVVHFSKTRPEWELNDGVPQSMLQERQETYDQCMKDLGLSQWSVGGVQPDNIKSGEGLRVLEQKEEGRAVPAGQNWESAHVDLAECCVMAACDGFKINKDLTIWADDEDNGEGLRMVEFKEVANLLINTDSYFVEAYPTSILPSQPQAKYERVKEWEDKGWIDSATAAALTDMPDVTQESSLSLAGIKSIRHAITQIIRRGDKGMQPPEPEMPLQLGVRIAQATFLKGLRTGMPEDRLQLLREWGQACMDLIEQANPAPTASAPGQAAPNAPQNPVNAPPPPPGAGAPPPGPGGPPMPAAALPAAPGEVAPNVGPV